MALNQNKRIFWAVQAVGLAPDGSTSFTPVHGVQSVGITTTFNLQQVFELGQIAIYENIEDTPDVEVTMEKVLDGYPLIYHLATPNASSGTLTGRSTDSALVALSIFGDVQDSASGTPNSQVTMSGMFVSSLSYSLPIDGFCTESVTLVGNDKTWKTSGFTFTGTLFDNTDVPLAETSGVGGVQQRQDVLFDSLTDDSVSILPGGTNGIPGISSSGTNDLRSDGSFEAKIQNISFSTDLGRENLFEMGHRNPYFRFVTFPTEVTTEIEAIAIDGDLVEATEAGVLGDGNNLAAKRILVVLRDSTKFDTGSQNKLASVSYGGGDAGGGNATTSFTYTTFNELTITQDQDPAGQ